MSYYERRKLIKYIHKIGDPYIDKRYNETITTLEDRVFNLEKEAKEQSKLLTSLSNCIDNSVYIGV